MKSYDYYVLSFHFGVYMLFERNEYLQRIIDKMWNGQIKVITGIRRCGKSILLFELFYDYLIKNGVPKQNIIKIELDKIKNVKFRNPVRLSKYIENKISNIKEKYYVFIDEIQFCKSIPDKDEPDIFINIYDMLNELKDFKNLDVYVTGSNSKMLSRDIETEFRGRASQIRIFPLSFKEFHNIKKGDIKDNLQQYMLYGGMPFLTTLKKNTEKKEYLISLFNEVYIRDIIERNNLERQDVLENILDYISSTISSLTNPNNITNSLNSIKHLKVSINTVSDYIRFLQDAFLVNETKRYDIKGKRYFEYPNKYYFADLGLRNARLNFRQFDTGHIMENIIYNELISRGYSVDIGVVADRRNKSNIQKEIDFVVNYGDKRLYIQSAFELTSREKEISEIDSLKLAKDFFKKIIIQNDIPESYLDESGIFHCKLTDFLLDTNIIL